ncbi:Flp pilus assembly protein CpaB [Clostridium sp. ZS2-4]|uniref:Flp pilus assembly protein CpaB n=1 Tax=Clostridium sp. ZS2-4 TaxID=2987703 RepID=UPI00227D27F6|nr:RcpC/CpaB family pilus assembly protein [Clostridium sp. ZS2-4]MCY6356217.1 RcpC/CpaB family pilus assembly protein [Clostridium sp. ZS2-4]
MKNLFKNRTVIGLTAIVLSLIICFGVIPLFNNALQSKISVVRIVKDVKEGEQIIADKIQVVEIGGYNLPDTVLKNKENVLGKYAAADLFKGDYVLNTKVSDNPLVENKYLYGLDGNKQAISISIKSFAAGLSGKLQAGDIISIIASNYGEFRETITLKELQCVRVLAVTTDKGADKEYTDDKKVEKEQELPSTVTLLVNKTQAKLLAELEENSKIHVSLIYRGNEETAQKFIEEQEKIIKDSSGNIASNVEVSTIKQVQGGM